jgi:prevent-host-death family protein
MKEIPISQLRDKCSTVLEQMRKTKEPILVTRHGKPVAEIAPPSLLLDRSAWIGSMKDSIEILGDIISPANEEGDWEALRS